MNFELVFLVWWNNWLLYFVEIISDALKKCIDRIESVRNSLLIARLHCSIYTPEGPLADHWDEAIVEMIDKCEKTMMTLWRIKIKIEDARKLFSDSQNWNKLNIEAIAGTWW